MSVYFDYEIPFKTDFDLEKTIRETIAAVLQDAAFPYESSVEVIITDDENIREVNREMRNLDQATDVLSFPMVPFSSPMEYNVLEESLTDYVDPETSEILLGDIMLSKDHILKQAEEYGHSVKRETAFLVAHSMLHLLGYDHISDEERKVMEEKQEEILQNLGITRD